MIDLNALPILQVNGPVTGLPHVWEITWMRFQYFLNPGVRGKATNMLKIEYSTSALDTNGSPQYNSQIKEIFIPLAEGKEIYDKTRAIYGADTENDQSVECTKLIRFHKQAIKHARNVSEDLAVDGSQQYLFGCRTQITEELFDKKNPKSRKKYGKKSLTDVISYFFIDGVTNQAQLRIEWKGQLLILNTFTIIPNPKPGQPVIVGYHNTEAMKLQFGRDQNNKGKILDSEDLESIKQQQRASFHKQNLEVQKINAFPVIIPHKIELSKTKLKNQQLKAELATFESHPEEQTTNQVEIEIDGLQQYNLRKKEQRQGLLHTLKLQAIDYFTAPEYLSDQKEIEMKPQDLARSLLTKKKQAREQAYNQKLQEFQEEYDLLVQICDTEEFQNDQALQEQVTALHESWIERVSAFNEEFADLIAELTAPEPELSIEQFEEEFPDDREAQEIALAFAMVQSQLNKPTKKAKPVHYAPKTSKSGLFIVESENDHYPVPVENSLEELEAIKLHANRERSLAKMEQLGISKYDSMIFGEGDDVITREDVRKLYGDDFFSDDYDIE